MEPAALLALAAAALSGLPPASPGLRRIAFCCLGLVLTLLAAGSAGAALGPPATRWEGTATAGEGVRVQPGDSLWRIARSVLVAHDLDPTPSRVDRYWRVIYEANHRLIGPDPDLILPGQRLVLPPPEGG